MLLLIGSCFVQYFCVFILVSNIRLIPFWHSRFEHKASLFIVFLKMHLYLKAAFSPEKGSISLSLYFMHCWIRRRTFASESRHFGAAIELTVAWVCPWYDVINCFALKFSNRKPPFWLCYRAFRGVGLSSIRLRMLLIEVSKELLLSKIVCDVKLRTETRLSKLSLVYGPKWQLFVLSWRNFRVAHVRQSSRWKG